MIILSKTKSIYLFDVAGAIIFTFVFAPLVSLVWNFIVVVALLIYFSKIKSVGWLGIIASTLVITIVGGILDIVPLFIPYYLRQGTRLPDLIIPMILIGLFNYYFSLKVFRLERNQSINFGIVMGILTAPWLLTYTNEIMHLLSTLTT